MLLAQQSNAQPLKEMRGELEPNGHCSVSSQQHQGASMQVKHHISVSSQPLHAGRGPDTTESPLSKHC